MREFKTRREISDWLTQELRKFPGCEETTASVQYELQKPDTDGCNWSRDILLNFGRNDSVVSKDRLRPLFEEARRRFNVREP
jgi:hypothetical protein